MLRIEPDSQYTVVLLAIHDLRHRNIALVFQHGPNQTDRISRKFLINYKLQ